MIGKRELACRLLDYTRIPDLVAACRRRAGRSPLTILAYHRICGFDSNTGFDLDEELISATKEDFRHQVQWVKEYFNPTTFADLEKEDHSANPLIITFDDGYIDNYENAFPILRRYKVPATIFLTTGYIGTGKLLWWDALAFIVKSTRQQRVEFTVGERLHSFSIGTKAKKKRSIEDILRLLKKIPDTDRIECLNQIKAFVKDVSESDYTGREMLKWEHVEEMSQNGIEFGAHSVSHPVLSRLSPELIYQEVSGSKKDIESRLNKKCTAFSYPVGGHASYNPNVISCVKDTGYRYAVSYVHGMNAARETDSYQLKRIHIEKEDTIATFKSKVMFPSIIRY